MNTAESRVPARLGMTGWFINKTGVPQRMSTGVRHRDSEAAVWLCDAVDVAVLQRVPLTRGASKYSEGDTAFQSANAEIIAAVMRRGTRTVWSRWRKDIQIREQVKTDGRPSQVPVVPIVSDGIAPDCRVAFGVHFRIAVAGFLPFAGAACGNCEPRCAARRVSAYNSTQTLHKFSDAGASIAAFSGARADVSDRSIADSM